MKKLKIIAFIFLAIHLFAIHTRLIFHINPDNEIARNIFSFLAIGENTISSEIFAIAYSLMTVYVIYYSHIFYTVVIFAILDGLAVFIYYKFDFAGNEILFAAIYYALYTCLIILSMKLIDRGREISEPKKIANKLQSEMNEIEETEILSDTIDKKLMHDALKEMILNLKNKGMKQKDIANRLNISESKVSRVINK